MQLFIKTPTGNTVTLEVRYSDTFDIVKAKIKDMKEIPDECNLDNCYIHWEPVPKPTIKWVGWLAGSMQLFVRTVAGNLITLVVDKFDTISKLKFRIKHVEGIDPFKQQHLIFYLKLEVDGLIYS